MLSKRYESTENVFSRQQFFVLNSLLKMEIKRKT